MIVVYSITFLLLASSGQVENSPFFGDIINTGFNIIGGVVQGALGAIRGTVVAIGQTIEQVLQDIDRFLLTIFG